MGKIFDEVNEKVFNPDTTFEELRGLCLNIAIKLDEPDKVDLAENKLKSIDDLQRDIQELEAEIARQVNRFLSNYDVRGLDIDTEIVLNEKGYLTYVMPEVKVTF